MPALETPYRVTYDQERGWPEAKPEGLTGFADPVISK